MSGPPEHDPLNPHDSAPPAEDSGLIEGAGPIDQGFSPGTEPCESTRALEAAEELDPEGGFSPNSPEYFSYLGASESPQPEIPPPARIPNLGDLCILIVLAFLGLVGSWLLTMLALHFHLFGVSTVQRANTDIHYTLGAQAALYLLAFGLCLVVFPLFWHKSFFAGLQWNGATALRLRGRLFAAAALCFVLAMVDEFLLPGPENAPIDKLFQTPMSAWLLFGFGVTFAPFFEEIVFRGFLLPTLCTAWDWTIERSTGRPVRPLDANGHPQWSIFAMIVASILTSIPFALMHAEQTAHALGPFLLLVCVSLVLCWARLAARSLAASVLVHASYNFILFSLMIIGTGGFQHMDKM